jgi:hypothetical protein
MRKRLISILLVLTLLFGVYTQSYAAGDEALKLGQVVVDGVALGTGALSGGLALLAALGISILSTDGGQQAVVDMYNYCDSVNKQAIADMHGDLIKAKSVLWEQASAFVNATYQVGDNLRRAVNFVISETGNVGTYTPSFGYEWNGLVGRVYIQDGWIYRTFVNRTTGVNQAMKYNQIYDGDWAKYKVVYRYSRTYVVNHTDTFGNIDYYTVVHEDLFDIDTPSGNYYGEARTHDEETFYQTTVPTYDNSVTTVSDQPYYDYTRSGVAIPVPQELDGDRIIAVPQSIPYTGGIGLTGDMVIPQTDVLTDATTHVDSETGESETNEFRPPEMQVPPALGLTRKFPFSIPWDLKLAVTSLVAEPKAPHWEINWDSQYFVGGGKTVIDFEQFEVWAKVIRWGLLILFNYFLIINTRRLIGAS